MTARKINNSWRIDFWHDHLRYRKKSPEHSEVSRKMYALRSSLIPFFGEMSIDKISTLQVEQYKSKKMAEGLANKTINNHLTVLSSCLRTAQDWIDLAKIPKMRKLKLPPQKID